MDIIDSYYRSCMYGRFELYKRITYRSYYRTKSVKTPRIYLQCALAYLRKNRFEVLAITDCYSDSDLQTFDPINGIL